ncbi:hypothetical protein IJ182_10675 [bacterium]|nr:hypothetical protein [bacterium]
MRNKKNSLLNALRKQCTKRVRICTMKFCAVGCLVEDYDDEDIVCLEDVEMIFTDGCRPTEHRDSVCICDDHIIAFEAISKI